MHLLALLRRLLAIPGYRRLFLLRVFTQAADGTLQVGMASYILFSPQSQPDAGAIAAVLAITLLPFSIVGPFVSTLLDRWSRRQVSVVVDVVRALIALAVASIVLTGHRTPASQTALYLLLLVAMSLNRFTLAGLAAGMHHVLEHDDFLAGSSLMPMVGPFGVLLGGAMAAMIRFMSAHRLPSNQGDALIFCVAAGLWLVAVVLALGFGRDALGPDAHESQHGTPTSPRAVLLGLGDTLTHLRHRTPAALALVMVTCQRVLFGLLSVSVILMYRNRFHTRTQANGALAGFGAWAGATGVGFVLSASLVPPLTRRFGLRTTATALLVASGIAQAFPGTVLRPWALVTSGFFIGWFAQSFKICIDTLVQAHVDAGHKGRTFVIYDVLFNLAMVVAALLAMVVLPADGASHLVAAAMAGGYLVLALVFWFASARIGVARFLEGTRLP